MADFDQQVLDIQALAQTDPAKALQETQRLFFTLVQSDSIFITPMRTLKPELFQKRSFRPFTAPIDGGNEDLYIRIFSDRKLVAKFVMEHEIDPTCVAELNGIELMQLAKYWFVRGVTGFILNDGAKWITITTPDFLKVIYEELLGQSQKYNQEFVDLIQFIYDCKSYTKKMFLMKYPDDTESLMVNTEDGMLFCFLDEQLANNYQNTGCEFVDVTEEYLKSIFLKHGPAMIRTVDKVITTSMRNIRYAYACAVFPEEVGL